MSILKRAQEVDLALFRRLARANSPALDATLPRLSRAANHSKLWMAIAAALGLFGGKAGKRAGLRGTIALGVTSIVVNTAVKGAARRIRPDRELVPVARRLKRWPRSSSFPSGHAASAAAFATAVALEHRVAGAATGTLAAAVGVSRVYSGVHYPGDVVAGFAFGAGAAFATLRFWPRAPREQGKPALTFVPVDTDGDGVGIVINASAGSTHDGIASALAEDMPDAEIIDVEDGALLPATLRALGARSAVIGVAGGDGSINAAATIAHEQKKPLLVVPGGTLNHLARDLGLESVEDAARAFQGRRAAQVDLAAIDGKPFLNTASFGPYPDIVDEREKREKRIGKWPALVVALLKVLRRAQPVAITVDGVHRRIWLIFIGNCRYEPSGLFPATRTRLDDGSLDVRIVNAEHRFALARLIAGLLTGRLQRSKVYEERTVTSLEITSHEGSLRLSRDGETFDGSSTFRVEKVTSPLHVFVIEPEDGQSRTNARPAMNRNASKAAIPNPVSHGPACL